MRNPEPHHPPQRLNLNESSFAAVVFDMDGLLLNTEALARRAMRLAGAELGVDLPEAFCALMIGVPVDGCRRLLLEHYQDALSADDLFAASTRHLKAQIDAGEMHLKPGVQELLDLLEAHHLPRAVATSSSREKAVHHLSRAGIRHRFDALLTRDDVSHGKPHPDLYLAAAEALGMAPSRCLALEDSYNGVRAASAAGMPVVMVPDLLAPTDEMRTLCLAVVHDLHDVVDMLQRTHGARRLPSRGIPTAGSLLPPHP
jgi:HAD superfamily hydrolase (TIGR01509 family)